MGDQLLLGHRRSTHRAIHLHRSRNMRTNMRIIILALFIAIVSLAAASPEDQVLEEEFVSVPEEAREARIAETNNQKLDEELVENESVGNASWGRRRRHRRRRYHFRRRFIRRRVVRRRFSWGRRRRRIFNHEKAVKKGREKLAKLRAKMKKAEGKKKMEAKQKAWKKKERGSKERSKKEGAAKERKKKSERKAKLEKAGKEKAAKRAAEKKHKEARAKAERAAKAERRAKAAKKERAAKKAAEKLKKKREKDAKIQAERRAKENKCKRTTVVLKSTHFRWAKCTAHPLSWYTNCPKGRRSGWKRCGFMRAGGQYRCRYTVSKRTTKGALRQCGTAVHLRRRL